MYEQYPKYKPMGNTINEEGNRYGRLLVLYPTKYKNKVYWICECDCGNISRVYGTKLRKGETLSCGCYIKEKV